MRFRFILTPLDEVPPWYTGSKPHLDWFSLTDGWYWVEIGGQEFLRYTDAFLEYWQQRHDNSPVQYPYPLYPIAEYYNFLLDKLEEHTRGDANHLQQGTAINADTRAPVRVPTTTPSKRSVIGWLQIALCNISFCPVSAIAVAVMRITFIDGGHHELSLVARAQYNWKKFYGCSNRPFNNIRRHPPMDQYPSPIKARNQGAYPQW